ncbi:6-phospho-3-hexuloisomerase [Paenibacillus cookii]|uniref:6-phospho 3-hexuloisomerase n=1 Tax=Paenibacillus cookii TaxID=157839 RepID=A0ABQ4LVQ0_9BACL|nr:6-phospho-3-hexuloisomerase [Paenibacillus cookii]GIO67339.1 6-phospho 3-hexuloisomerase [Paenibacillus cookii]
MINKLMTILAEARAVLERVDESDVNETAALLAGAPRIFVVGEGRSGLMAKSFAMRLMHLGATSYVIGETITPSIAEGDYVIAVSGSGTTHSVVWTAGKARELGASVIALTTDVESPLARSAVRVLAIPAATKHRREGESASIQPLGSLFDQCVHLVLDAVCLCYAESRGVDNAAAFKQHSNVE